MSLNDFIKIEYYSILKLLIVLVIGLIFMLIFFIFLINRYRNPKNYIKRFWNSEETYICWNSREEDLSRLAFGTLWIILVFSYIIYTTFDFAAYKEVAKKKYYEYQKIERKK